MDPLSCVPSNPPASTDLLDGNVNSPHVSGGASPSRGGAPTLQQVGASLDTEMPVNMSFGETIEATSTSVEDQYQNGGLTLPVDPLSAAIQFDAHPAQTNTPGLTEDSIPADTAFTHSQAQILSSQILRPVTNDNPLDLAMTLPEICINPTEGRPSTESQLTGSPQSIQTASIPANSEPLMTDYTIPVTASSAFASIQQSYDDDSLQEDSATAVTQQQYVSPAVSQEVAMDTETHPSLPPTVTTADTTSGQTTDTLIQEPFALSQEQPLPLVSMETDTSQASVVTPSVSDSVTDASTTAEMTTSTDSQPSQTMQSSTADTNQNKERVSASSSAHDKADVSTENNNDKREGKAAEMEVIVDKPIDEKPGTYSNDKLCKATMKHMNELRTDGKFCDALITLQTSEQGIEQPRYWVHRCVLAASSSQFQAQFKNTKHAFEEVTMTSENAKAFEALLDYLYTGDLFVTMSTIDELLFLAKQLDLEEVVLFCDRHLQRSIDPDNWVEVFHIASTYNLGDTVKAVENFGVSKFITVVQDVNILDLPETIIEPIIRRCNPRRNLNAELLSLQLVINWTIHQFEERNDKLGDFLGYIRKKLIPQESLDFILNAEAVKSHQIYHHKALVDFRNDVVVAKEKVILAKKAKEELEKKQRELEERERDLKRTRKRLKQKLRQQRHEKRELEKSEMSIKQEVVDEITKEQTIQSNTDTGTTVGTVTVSTEMSENIVTTERGEQAAMATDTTTNIVTTMPSGTTMTDSPFDGSQTGTESTVTSKEQVQGEIHPIVIQPQSRMIDEVATQARSAEIAQKHAVIDENIRKSEEELKKVDRLLLNYSPDVAEDLSDDGIENDIDSDWEPPVLEEDGDLGPSQAGKLKGNRRKSYRPTRVMKGSYSLSPHTSDDDMKGDEDYLEAELKSLVPKPPGRRRGRPPGSKNKLTVKLKKRASKLKKLKSQKVPGRPRGRPRKIIVPGEIPRMKGRVKIKHKCSFEGCNYSSWRKCDLEDHVNSHTGLRPHMCTVCNKGFVSRKHLRRHKYIHLDGKSHTCEFCEYTTVRRDKIKEHLRLHHPDIAVERGLMKPEDVGKIPIRKRQRRLHDKIPGIATLTVGEDGKITMATQTLSDEEKELGIEDTYEDGFPKGPLPLPAKKRRRRTKAVPSGNMT